MENKDKLMPREWLGRAAVAVLVLSQLAACTPAAAPSVAPSTPAATAAGEPVIDAPGWLTSRGAPSADARAALTVLRTASDDGLDPDDYRSGFLDQLADKLDTGGGSPDDLAAFDDALQDSFLRYLTELHGGRVDPASLGMRSDIAREPVSFEATLSDALSQHDVAQAAADARPRIVLYRRLRLALATYRTLAQDPQIVPPAPAAKKLSPGDTADNLQEMSRWLVALGDLAPGDAPTATETVYEGAMVDAVSRFQVRHGLEPDGVLGSGTWSELAVPLTARILQIELALERLRWLPPLGERRIIAVNIPMFHLWAWRANPPDGVPDLDMDVIVGRSLSTETPVMIDQMTHVIFRPYWNVPASILAGEIVPAMTRDSGWLARHDMEIVSGQGDDAAVVPQSPSSLARLRRGALRVRQRPGERNSLGLVKFVFPNADNIYLHGTSAPGLFGRPRRDLSHGCVRLEDPVGLAEWVLNDQPGQDRARIVAAMNSGKPTQVNVPEPILTVLFYLTAVATPPDGVVLFAQDLYGHDATLVKALAARTLQP